MIWRYILYMSAIRYFAMPIVTSLRNECYLFSDIFRHLKLCCNEFMNCWSVEMESAQYGCQRWCYVTWKPSVYHPYKGLGHMAKVMKVGKCTAGSPHCGEDEDAEEERGREELQTAEDVGGFPSWLWSWRPITLYSFQPQEKIRPDIPPVWHPATLWLLMCLCPFSNVHQSLSVHGSLQRDCCLFVRPVNDVTLADIHHQHYHTDSRTNHYFHQSCRPSGNEKTGARRQMFGEVIDLRWEDCDAAARDGHVIALDGLQSSLTWSSHALMSLALFTFNSFVPSDTLSDGCSVSDAFRLTASLNSGGFKISAEGKSIPFALRNPMA